MRILLNLNWPITLCSLLLLSIGILVIYSSSKELAIQQLIFAFLGMILFFFISNFDYRSLKNLIKPLYVLCILLLVLVLFLGIETRGSIRWIPLGFFNIQPSEFAKPILILVLANFWSMVNPNWINIFKSLLWILPLCLLIFKQPDLGSTLTILAIWAGSLFDVEVSLKRIIILVLISVLVVPVSWISLHEYQRQRIVSFLTPQSDPLGRGYNLIQSTIAVGSGQFLGRGLGRGTQSRLQFLPEFRTDFIFASISEEMGFIGSLIILALYFFLIFYSLRQANQTDDLFGHLIIFGVISMLLFQAMVNIGMNIGLIPITGITLPLISYGGSSLLVTLISLGLVASVSKFAQRIDSDT